MGRSVALAVLITSIFIRSFAYSQGYETAPVKIASDQNLDFRKFKNLLIDQNINSVESALPILANKFPDYLTFNTLMYASLSIQESSFEEPRVIVFGPEARFIFSFDGNENQAGGREFETVQYSKTRHEFEFREVIFKYPGFDKSALDLEANEVEFQNQNLVVSTANPAKCQMCHGQITRPLWPTYYLWPGAYGSDDDQLEMSFDRSSWNPNNEGFFKQTNKPSSQGRRMAFRPGFPDTELLGLVRYASAKANHPRYKWLPTTIAEAAVVQYAKGVPFAQLDYSADAHKERERLNAGYAWPSRPNLYFLMAVQALGDDKLVARLEKARLRNAFASAQWDKLTDGYRMISVKDVIPIMASRISKLFSELTFKGTKPTELQIEGELRKNLADEFGMQQERIARQDSNLGRGSLRYQPYVNNSRGVDEYADAPSNPNRDGMPEIENAKQLYSALMGFKRFTELDKIAAGIETDDQFRNTAIAMLLADRGIDLHDYNLNLRQMSLAFHTDGLNKALIYLGVERPRQ